MAKSQGTGSERFAFSHIHLLFNDDDDDDDPQCMGQDTIKNRYLDELNP